MGQGKVFTGVCLFTGGLRSHNAIGRTFFPQADHPSMQTPPVGYIPTAALASITGGYTLQFPVYTLFTQVPYSTPPPMPLTPDTPPPPDSTVERTS